MDSDAVIQMPEFSGERRHIELDDGQQMEFVLIPSGRFRMGCVNGFEDERPRHVVEIASPFWMSVTEITNEQYALFNPHHDSGVESKYGYQFGIHGYPLNEPDQPVVRVSWREAMAYCDWLSALTGLVFTLPTEAQWEYACRAGSETHFHFGDCQSDYAAYANIADETLEQFVSNPYFVFAPFESPNRYDAWIPRDMRYSDGALLTAPVGAYCPNAWGLHDTHGNVWEWT
jgi:formylglycine-generating enzyme required for sulfatase activity